MYINQHQKKLLEQLKNGKLPQTNCHTDSVQTHSKILSENPVVNHYSSSSYQQKSLSKSPVRESSPSLKQSPQIAYKQTDRRAQSPQQSSYPIYASPSSSSKSDYSSLLKVTNTMGNQSKSSFETPKPEGNSSDLNQIRLAYESQMRQNAQYMLEMIQQSNNSAYSLIETPTAQSPTRIISPNGEKKNPFQGRVESPVVNKQKKQDYADLRASPIPSRSVKSSMTNQSPNSYSSSIQDLTTGWGSPVSHHSQSMKQGTAVTVSSSSSSQKCVSFSFPQSFSSKNDEEESELSPKKKVAVTPFTSPKIFEESFEDLVCQFNRLLKSHPNDLSELQEYEDLLSLVKKEKQIVSSDIKYLTSQRDKYKDMYQKQQHKPKSYQVDTYFIFFASNLTRYDQLLVKGWIKLKSANRHSCVQSCEEIHEPILFQFRQFHQALARRRQNETNPNDTTGLTISFFVCLKR